MLYLSNYSSTNVSTFIFKIKSTIVYFGSLLPKALYMLFLNRLVLRKKIYNSARYFKDDTVYLLKSDIEHLTDKEILNLSILNCFHE